MCGDAWRGETSVRCRRGPAIRERAVQRESVVRVRERRRVRLLVRLLVRVLVRVLMLGGRGGRGRDVAAHAFGGRLGTRGGGGLQGGGEGAGRNDAVEGRAQRGGGRRRGDDGRHGPGTKGEERARRARARSLARGGFLAAGLVVGASMQRRRNGVA